jgi:molybdopterin/thiamine biosynthesis adenylyltransferase
MSLARYHRQMLLAGIGEAGQQRLAASHALVVGCGALGTMIVDALARAGVGTLTIVDRDVVELTNLQRQILFDERDVEQGMPKAEAAKAKVARVNSQVAVHAHVDDFSHRSAARYVEGVDIIMDGLDNFETRYLLNDIAVSRGIPYIYGGAVGTTGVTMAILPSGAMRQVDSTSRVKWPDDQSTPCLRCVFPEAPPPGTSPTCDTAGVLGPAVAVIAAQQAAQAIKLLTGHVEALDRALVSIDIWTNEFRRFDVSAARQSECPCCGRGQFVFLDGATGSAAMSLCGRNAVQISPSRELESTLDLPNLAARLTPHGSFTVNEYLLRGTLAGDRNGKGEPIELTVFPNGRTIIKGVTETDAARSIYAKYIGA